MRWRSRLHAKIEAAKEQARIEADKELTLKELDLKIQQDQASISLAATPPPRNKDAKSPKLPSFIDDKDKLDSYCYALNTTLRMLFGRKTQFIKLSAVLTGRQSHGCLCQDVRCRRH